MEKEIIKKRAQCYMLSCLVMGEKTLYIVIMHILENKYGDGYEPFEGGWVK
jgi:ABC-type dipeptide/oligopeptide/nickel transport system permease subunit